MPSAQELRKPDPEQPGIRMSGTAFQIVDQYQDMIYRTALTLVGNREDAEDILQEVFLKYFRLRPAFESESHEKAWFLRVTINEGKNLLKSFWKRRRTDVTPEDLEKIPQPDAQNPDADHNHQSEVLQAVLALPEKYRIAIYLYYYEEYSIREIAGMTGSSETAVAQHLSRGRQKLRKKLEGSAHGSA